MKEWPCVQIAHSALSTVGIAGMRVVATGRPDGSSPHVRGTPRRCSQAGRVARFIPACAGNASRPTAPRCSLTVHPRIRGERDRHSPESCMRAGSSPHTRGTRHKCAHRLSACRFIPAYAGNANWRCATRQVWTVHPRIRGERAKGRFPSATRTGSSPHTRGTPEHPAGQPVPARFIPAYAGNARRG